MPGIVGLITRMPSERAKEELCRMVKCLRHESFYTVGTWADEGLGVYIGWSAARDSFSSGMPFRNESGDVVLVFSGEEFCGAEALPRLKNKGHAIESGDGPSYLVHLYEEEPSFFGGLDGMFHGIVVDRTRGTATLFNDRYGMYRLYYHESNEAFYFAAEAKAILAVRPELKRANPRSLGEFVACSCVLQDRTLFEGIYRLPAASAWTFRNGSVERKTYFSPRQWEEQPPLDSERYYDELRGAVARNLPKYFNERERIGIALTGGLDTRIIMAWQRASSNSLACYTFGGPVRESQDVLLARRVAKACGYDHEVISVNGDFCKNFPRYAERTMYLAEGTVDMSRSPDLYVSERAREIAPIKVVGTYGSEIVQQLAMFKPVQPNPDLFRPELLSWVREAEGTYAELRREHPVTFAAFRQSPWYHSGVLALEQSQLTVRSPFLNNDFVRAAFRAPALAHENSDVRLRLIRDGNPALGRIRSDRGVGGAGRPLARTLSRAMLEFSFRSEYAYDSGMPHWLARVDHLFSPLHLERIFLGRHKFLHFRVWYRDALSKYIRDVLLDPRTLARPYLQRKGVEAAVLGHVKGDRNYTTEIHKLLSLELLHRLFLDA